MSEPLPLAINVKDYGAVGDGETDDTAAIVAAMQAGSTLYFPPGTYKFSRVRPRPRWWKRVLTYLVEYF